MSTSNKRWYAGIVVVIAVFAVTLVLFAQEHPKKNNSQNYTYDSSYWNTNVPEKYWLSDDQVNQVNKIKTEYDRRIQPEIEKLNSVRGEFSAYRQQDEISSKRIKEYQTRLRDIEDNIYSLKMEAASKIRNVFGKGQRPYYNNNVFNDWCDDWGWNYSGYMNYGMRDHSQRDGFPGYMDCGWGWGDMGSGMRGHDRMYNRGGCW